MPESGEEFEVLRRDLREQRLLIKENTRLLKKLYRQNVIGAFLKFLWLLAVVGVPFAFYMYYLKPYIGEVKGSYEEWKEGMENLPRFEGLEKFLPTKKEETKEI